ncbi:hypothetical protein LOAG_08702 [Loa loa]|uniref:Uncharacterized protein n=1 Tax=Loa loa TaxID=7209 RepID=A0A1S0TT94_LOALO|nr:hypothetical protein LOAG_08702 [Loa loa]EFO19789.1 hypothetical protein LOAG_08702 [Loa loa]
MTSRTSTVYITKHGSEVLAHECQSVYTFEGPFPCGASSAFLEKGYLVVQDAAEQGFHLLRSVPSDQCLEPYVYKIGSAASSASYNLLFHPLSSLQDFKKWKDGLTWLNEFHLAEFGIRVVRQMVVGWLLED